MRAYSLTHLRDRELLRDLATLVAQDRATTAALLAHLAEVDTRRLYVPAGYASMYEYCVGELRLSEDAAYKRIRVARTARQFPTIYSALAEGRLHLSAVVLLAPHLTPENADELLGTAARKSKAEIELLLAQRFPRTEWLPMVHALPASGPRRREQLAPGPVEAEIPAIVRDRSDEPAPGQVGAAAMARGGAFTDEHAPGQVGAPGPPPKVAPLSAESFALHLTMGKGLHDKLRYAQALTSHRNPSGDLAAVLEGALDCYIRQLEKQKFAATDCPQTGPRRSTSSRRHIPAHVKRAVWERDRGQCTFVGASGHRCSARRFLEFDHIDPVARGGQATVERMRLRCRTHNQHEAECTFGAGFMADKREAARCAARAALRESERKRSAAADPDVLAALRTLGFRADESRRAAALCADLASASLEERVRRALSYFRPRASSHTAAVSSLGRAP